MVQMQEVTSSQIARLGYDVEESTLYVDFKPSGSYRYGNISPELYESMMGAESIGSFFNRTIKGNSAYPYERIGATAKKPASEVVAPVEPVDPAVIEQSAITIADQAKAVRITTSAEYLNAAEMLKSVVAMRKQVEDTFSPMKEAAHKAHKAVCDQKKKILGPVAEAERHLRSAIATHQTNETRERRAEEERIRAERQREADEDAKRRSEDLAIADAEEAHAAGNPELAEQIIANPLPLAPAKVAPVVIRSEVPKVAGIGTRQVWKFRIVDANLIPRQYLIPDESAIGQVARALKDRTTIPGVEVYDESSVSVGARA